MGLPLGKCIADLTAGSNQIASIHLCTHTKEREKKSMHINFATNETETERDANNDNYIFVHTLVRLS